MDKQDKSYQRFQELLAKVRNQTISENEMREVNQLAKTDPFWADALDGYMSSGNADDHNAVLQRLSQKVTNRTTKKEEKRRILPIWVRGVAALMVIGLGAWLIGSMLKQNDFAETVAERQAPTVTEDEYLIESEIDQFKSVEVPDMVIGTADEAIENLSYKKASPAEPDNKSKIRLQEKTLQAPPAPTHPENPAGEVVEEVVVASELIKEKGEIPQADSGAAQHELPAVVSDDQRLADTIEMKDIAAAEAKADDTVNKARSNTDYYVDGIRVQSAVPATDTAHTFDQTARLQDYGAVSNAGGLRPNQVGHSIIGKVLDPDGFPLIGANVMEEGTSNGVVTDIDGRFFLTLQDTNHALTVNYVGYENLVYQLGSERDGLELIMQGAMETLDEVVVVGYGNKSRKSKQTTSESQPTAEPKGGIKKLNKYIIQNTRRLISKSLSGKEVSLSFTVNTNGQLSEFRTVNTNDDEVANIVIQLLADGPQWKTKPKGESVYTIYTIQF